MQPTLYDIEAEYLGLVAALEDLEGDVTGAEEEFDKLFAQVDQAFDLKVDGYARIVRNLEARAGAIKAEGERLAEIRKALGNRVDWLKRRMIDALETLDRKKAGQVFSVQRVKNGGKPPIKIEDPGLLPEPFVIVEEVRKPDMDALRKQLEKGEHVDGAELLPRGQHLRIK